MTERRAAYAARAAPFMARRRASVRLCSRISGTALVSQKVPLVSGPSANRLPLGRPLRRSSCRPRVVSRPEGLRTREPAAQEVAHQRIRDLPEVERRAGAVHEPVADDAGLDVAAPGPEADRDPFVTSLIGLDRAGPGLEPAARLHVLNLDGDLRRHAVAVDVPVGPQVAQEAPALNHRQPLPKQGHVVAPRVEHGTPVDAGALGLRDLTPKMAQQRARGQRPIRPLRGRRPARRRTLFLTGFDMPEEEYWFPFWTGMTVGDRLLSLVLALRQSRPDCDAVRARPRSHDALPADRLAATPRPGRAAALCRCAPPRARAAKSRWRRTATQRPSVSA